jgi:hypothetical protein
MLGMALDFGSIALSALVASGSSVLTTWLTPKFGHSIWKRQRREELRLAAIASLIKLTGEFYQLWLEADMKGVKWQPSMGWYLAKHSVDVEIKALFSEEANLAYRDLDKRFSPELGTIDGRPSHSAFERAYTTAYEKLYGEVFG